MNLSVILPTFNEDENIKNFIKSIQKIDKNIEIIAVDNKSQDNTKNEIKKTTAKYVYCNNQGYGIAIKTGLNKATRKYLAICEPDGTFQAKDIKKLFTYLKKYDAVFGTRTNINFIRKFAKMNYSLRMGNILFAKIIQILFKTSSISDVGCSLKIFKKSDYLKIKKNLIVNKSEFQPELMINLFLLNCRIVEIPVIYQKRVGYSKITSNLYKTSLLAIKMFFLIIKLRLLSLLK